MKPAMKLSHVPGNVEKYLNDPAWIMAEKMDGRGMIAQWDGEQFTFYNLSGQAVDWRPELGRTLGAALSLYDYQGGPFMVQGELVRAPGGAFENAVYHMWAMLDTDRPFEARHVALYDLHLEVTGYSAVVPHLQATSAKIEQYHKLYQEGAEGVVFSHQNGKYQFGGKRSKEVLKFKWVESADCAVFDFKESVAADVNGYRHGQARLGLLANDGSRLHDYGWVHVRQCELDHLEAWQNGKLGDNMLPVLEVQYLYASEGALIQPIAKKVRFDKVNEGRAAYTKVEQLRVSKLFRGLAA